ncbi:MAG: ABC transporter substrate-binding protein [Clostridium sp.]|nr:ABC transporter substrate-binding protein [Clostridium sp.]
MRRLISLFLICLVSVSLFVGCGNDSSNVTNISILNSKPEMEEALNDLIEEFTKQNNDINIKVVKYSQSGVYKDKLDSMQSIDNAPTMALIDPSNINLYADRCLNLSEENWVSNIVGGVDEIAKNKDGQVVAFPFATEGIGLIYNKKVLSEAGVDVNSINTISSLEESFKKIEASGKKGIVVTNEEWSLGDHFSATFYEVDRKKFNKSAIEYLNSISNEDLRSNATLNGLLDTFDLMKKYNIYAENPLAPSYDKCAEIFGKGEVVFWYMGNWASQSILKAQLLNRVINKTSYSNIGGRPLKFVFI